MDHFGIGAAMRGMFLNYMHSARRSGRTTSLVESVKDGDRIVFAERREAEPAGDGRGAEDGAGGEAIG